MNVSRFVWCRDHVDYSIMNTRGWMIVLAGGVGGI